MTVPAPSNARLVLNHPSFANSFSSLDPIKSGWDKLSLQVASDAWVGLTRQNETTLEIERGMAVTWQVSDTGEEWLFHILPGVPWVHYNSETGEVERVVDDEGEIRYVSAYDFVYGLNRMITDPDSDYSYLLYPWVGNPFDESQISVVDDITFRVTLDKPAGHFDVLMDLFSAAMPSWLIESVGGKWTAPAYFQGYGPYVLKDFVTVESLTIIRNPYWLGTDTIPVPQFAEITWRTVPEDALLSAFEAGELDRVYLPNDAVFDVISSEANQPLLSSMSGGCEVHYEFNTRKPPFDSAKVRLAFALATDRNLIVDVEKRGNLPSFWYSPTDARAGLAMSGLPVPELSYDVQTANDLLDEVYPNRNEIPEIVISYYTSTGGKGLIATELERQWEENLGVTVEHLPFADSSEFTARIYADPPNIYRASVCGDYNDANAYYDPDDVMERLMTRSGWSDETFSAAIESAASSMDQDLRGRLYAQAEEILVKSQAVILPLRWSRRYVLTQPYLHPVESHLVQVERFEKWSIDE
jgi:oligopeptide transport system substrate-binding protein